MGWPLSLVKWRWGEVECKAVGFEFKVSKEEDVLLIQVKFSTPVLDHL